MTRLFFKLLFLLFITTTALAKDATIKNVLFIISDDLKASVLGCYGDDVCETPNIDALAARGMLFERAYCQGTWCLPSRKSMMFSRYEGSGSKGHPSMSEQFKRNGWYSARVGKIYHMRVPGDIIAGTDGPDHAPSWTERFNCAGLEAGTKGLYRLLNHNVVSENLEKRQSTGDPHRMFVTVESTGDGTDQPDAKAADKAIELLRTHKESPFFLAVGLVRPHYPMVAPKRYFDKYPLDAIKMPKQVPDDLADIPAAGRARTLSGNSGIAKFPENQKRMWACYYASVTFMDDQIGRILAELDKLGLRDSTAIVFTSDHGYHLGEHTFWQKSNMHEEVTRIPMIVSAPGMKAGRTKALVELLDLYPTLTDLAGIATPEQVEGKSLLPILRRSQQTVRKAAFSLDKKSYCLRTDRWAYISYGANGKAGEELYDMNKDPNQFTNLAKRPEHAEVLRGFRADLKTRL